MKIIIEDKVSKEEEDTIIVRCGTLNDSLLKLLRQLKSGDECITCTQNGKIARIRPDDVYYFDRSIVKRFSIQKQRCLKYDRSSMRLKITMQALTSFARQNPRSSTCVRFVIFPLYLAAGWRPPCTTMRKS